MKTPSYCIQDAGNCFECSLSDGCKDCQGHTFFICLADYLEEPQAEPESNNPSYCTQNNGDCDTCPLMDADGRDCKGYLDLLAILEEVEEVDHD
jgi:hypothetical protein